MCKIPVEREREREREQLEYMKEKMKENRFRQIIKQKKEWGDSTIDNTAFYPRLAGRINSNSTICARRFKIFALCTTRRALRLECTSLSFASISLNRS